MRYRNDLTAEFVRSIFNLNEKDGTLTWRSQRRPQQGGNSQIGKIAGHTNTNGYRYVNINRRQYLLHRIIYLHKNGTWPAANIDHATGNPLDNTKIRDATDSQNLFNQKKSKKNTS